MSKFGLGAIVVAFVASMSGHSAPVIDQLHDEIVAIDAHVDPPEPCSNADAILRTQARIKPGWHLYWKHPGASGQAARIRVETPPGIEAAETIWPIPSRFRGELGGESIGYATSATFRTPIRFDSGHSSAPPAHISSSLDWVACNRYCAAGTTTTEALVQASRSTPASGAAQPDSAASWDCQRTTPSAVSSFWSWNPARSSLVIEIEWEVSGQIPETCFAALPPEVAVESSKTRRRATKSITSIEVMNPRSGEGGRRWEPAGLITLECGRGSPSPSGSNEAPTIVRAARRSK